MSKLVMTAEVKAQVYDLLEQGLSTVKIGAAIGVADCTIRQWYHRDATEEERKQYDLSRERGLEKHAEEIMEISDEELPSHLDPAMIRCEVERRRQRVDARKWILSKLVSRKFGDKLDLNADVKGQMTVNVITRPSAKD
jgi:IS30 family transposase